VPIKALIRAARIWAQLTSAPMVELHIARRPDSIKLGDVLCVSAALNSMVTSLQPPARLSVKCTGGEIVYFRQQALFGHLARGGAG